MVKESVSKEMRNFFNLKNKLNLQRLQDDSNILRKLMDLTGISAYIHEKDIEKPQVYSRGLHSFQDINEIDPLLSSHCHEL